MKKLISALTALTLSVVSAVPMFSNAIVLSPDMSVGSIDEMVKEVFGEEAIYTYDKSNYVYIVFSPDNLGDFTRDEGNLKVKLKKGSELDEKGLNQLVWKNCTPYVRCEKSDDNTYVFNRNRGTYLGPSSRMEEEIYPAVISFLSECEDVVSIDRYYNIAVETVKTGSRITGFSFLVSGNVDLDFDKYSDYKIEEHEDKSGIFSQKYYSVSADEGDNYFSDIYNAFINLNDDYGEENVKPCMGMYDVILEENKSCGTNVYTALITGDTNADGGIDIADALAIASYVGDPNVNQLNESSLLNADVNGDGFVDTIDILVIQQYLAGIITEL